MVAGGAEKRRPVASKYKGIVRELSHRISMMKQGDQLPSELQLSGEFGVSPMTVRRALQVLIDAGRVVAVRGKGTFVQRPGVVNRMEMRSFTQAVKSAGMEPSTQLLWASTSPSDKALAALLDIAPGAMAYRIERLRFADEQPIALEVVSLSADKYPGLLGMDLTRPLHELLATHFNTYSAEMETRIGAAIPDPREAELLRIDRSVPCLRLHSRRHDLTGRVELAAVALYRGDLWEVITNQHF